MATVTAKMTAADAPSPNAVTADDYYGTYYPWQAFDQSTVTHWYTAAALPHWLKYDFGVGGSRYMVTSYGIQPQGAYTPKSWTFDGSDNGTAWTTLDTQTNVTTGWTGGVLRTFGPFANTYGYRYYRINVTASNYGDSKSLEWQEVELYGDPYEVSDRDVDGDLNFANILTLEATMCKGRPWDTAAELNLASILSIDGQLSESYVNASATVPLELSGTMAIPAEINSSLTIPLEISGTMTEWVPKQINAVMDFGALLSLGDAIPLFSIYPYNVYVYPVIEGELSVNIPTHSLSPVNEYTDRSWGHVSCIGEMPIIEPKMFELDADVIISEIGEIDNPLPKFSFSSTGNITCIGDLLLNLPKLTLEMESAIHEVGELSVNLPMIHASSSRIDYITKMTFNESLPFMRFTATGHVSSEGTIAIDIPLLQLLSFYEDQDSFLSMVMNVQNKALTLFTNYKFNSMCYFNGKNFGAKATAIYELTGDTDDGTLIEWNFRTGYLDLEQKVKKKLKQAWFSYKSNGDLIVTVVQPDGQEYEYDLESYEVTEDGVRVKFGKGIRSKYVALDVKNSDQGGTIVLDVLRLHLDKAGPAR